jgi:hypothetical protein
VTICQVRRATTALLDALTLNPEDRTRRLAKTADYIRDDQKRNAAARASHTKTRLRRLKAVRIRLNKLRCCIPPRPGVALWD